MPAADDCSDLLLGERCGKGAYGVVMRAVAHHGTRSTDVAVKILPSDGSDQAARELRREVELQREAGKHPSIVKLLGCFQHDGSAWLLLELCVTSMQDVLRQRGEPLDEAQIAAVCAGTLRGLHWLHTSCQVVHRDIKAGNLLLTRRGELKIADFGVASRLDAEPVAEPESASPSKDDKPTPRIGTVIGSPLWMAPEMIEEGVCDTPVDLWSLGITCIELAELVPPHADVQPALHAMFRIVKGAPPALRDTARWSNAFHAFVASCLRKGPAQRASAAVLLHGAWCAAAVPHVSSRLSALLPPNAPAKWRQPPPADPSDTVAELAPILWAGFDERIRVRRVLDAAGEAPSLHRLLAATDETATDRASPEQARGTLGAGGDGDGDTLKAGQLPLPPQQPQQRPRASAYRKVIAVSKPAGGKKAAPKSILVSDDWSGSECSDTDTEKEEEEEEEEEEANDVGEGEGEEVAAAKEEGAVVEASPCAPRTPAARSEAPNTPASNATLILTQGRPKSPAQLNLWAEAPPRAQPAPAEKTEESEETRLRAAAMAELIATGNQGSQGKSRLAIVGGRHGVRRPPAVREGGPPPAVEVSLNDRRPPADKAPPWVPAACTAGAGRARAMAEATAALPDHCERRVEAAIAERASIAAGGGVRRGWLHKQTGSRTWTKRWVVLAAGGAAGGGVAPPVPPRLLIFKSVEDERPASVYPLSGGAEAVPLHVARPHAFEVRGGGGGDGTGASGRLSIGASPRAAAEASFERGLHRQVVFACDTACDFKGWLGAVRSQIAHAQIVAVQQAQHVQQYQEQKKAAAPARKAAAAERATRFAQAAAATRIASAWRSHAAHRRIAARRASLAAAAGTHGGASGGASSNRAASQDEKRRVRRRRRSSSSSKGDGGLAPRAPLQPAHGNASVPPPGVPPGGVPGMAEHALALASAVQQQQQAAVGCCSSPCAPFDSARRSDFVGVGGRLRLSPEEKAAIDDAAAGHAEERRASLEAVAAAFSPRASSPFLKGASPLSKPKPKQKRIVGAYDAATGLWAPMLQPDTPPAPAAPAQAVASPVVRARQRYEMATPRRQARDAQRDQLAALEQMVLDGERGWTPPPSPRMPDTREFGLRRASRSVIGDEGRAQTAR